MGYPPRRPNKLIFYIRVLIGNREAIEAKKQDLEQPRKEEEQGEKKRKTQWKNERKKRKWKKTECLFPECSLFQNVQEKREEKRREEKRREEKRREEKRREEKREDKKREDEREKKRQDEEEREDERENCKRKWREIEVKKSFFLKIVWEPSNPPGELAQNVSNKSLSDELSLHFSSKVQNVTVFSNYLHDSNSIFSFRENEFRDIFRAHSSVWWYYPDSRLSHRATITCSRSSFESQFFWHQLHLAPWRAPLTSVCRGVFSILSSPRCLGRFSAPVAARITGTPTDMCGATVFQSQWTWMQYGSAGGGLWHQRRIFGVVAESSSTITFFCCSWSPGSHFLDPLQRSTTSSRAWQFSWTTSSHSLRAQPDRRWPGEHELHWNWGSCQIFVLQPVVSFNPRLSGKQPSRPQEADFDDEQIRALLASPLYLQEREASAERSQVDHSERESLMSSSSQDPKPVGTGKPVALFSSKNRLLGNLS